MKRLTKGAAQMRRSSPIDRVLSFLLVFSILCGMLGFSAVKAHALDYETVTEAELTTPIGTYDNASVYLVKVAAETEKLYFQIPDGNSFAYVYFEKDAFETEADYDQTEKKYYLGKDTENYATAKSDYESTEITITGNVTLDNTADHLLMQVYYDDESIAYLLVEWATSSNGTSVDKTALADAIGAVPATGYHTSGDRYNGKSNDTIEDRTSGFWQQMQAVVSAAQSVYADEDATQDEVDAAAATLNQTNPSSALSLAIARLIPSDQINATKLYEAIQDCKDLSNSDNIYTAASWSAYQARLTAAQTLMSSYFKADGTPGEANVYSEAAQNEADTAADELTAAAAALVRRADRSKIIRSGVALAEIARLAAEYDPSKLDEEKYNGIQALVSARNAALQVLKASESITELTEAQFEQQADAMDALRAACYGLADKSGPITVHLSVTDSYAPRQSDPQSRNVITRDLSLPAGATVNDALTAAGISLTRVSTFQEIAVYLNGHYYVPEQASIFGGSARYLQAGLRDGDHLTLSFYEMPVAWSNDGTYRITVTLGEYMDDMRYQTVSVPATVKAGEAFTVNVTADGAMPTNYTGTAAPVEGTAIYAGAAFADRADAETAPVTEAVEAVTGADGKATVTLYAEGWCALNAFSTETDAGGLCNGPSVLIYVEPADDLNAVKTTLREELTAACADENYPESYFTASQWQSIQTAYSDGMNGIDAAATSGAAREAQLTALQEIRRIQANADRSNSSNLTGFRNLLNKLPEDLDKLDASSESTIQSLIASYEAMTEYQRGQLTPAEEERYQAIKERYDNGFAPAVSYQLTMVIDDSKVAAADREALAGMIGYLQEHTATCDTYSQVGGTEIAGLFTFNKADSLTYIGTTFTPITSSKAMETISACVNPDYAAYLLVRNAGGTLTAADGSWSISDQSLALDYDDVNMVYVNSGETYTVNGTQYEVQSVTVSGLEPEQVAEHTYSYYDSSDYMGKDEWHINMSFPGAFRRFTMPYNDVTVTVAWGPVSGTDDEIIAARESAAETIRSTYANYSQSDYSDANWATLTGIKDNALTQLQTAATLEAVRSIRQNALAGMASVERLSGSAVGLPDYGSTVGQVYVSVENTTFPECPYEQFRGEFLHGWYDLCERDTMMTAILKALKTEGFSWEGTGGTGDAYSITYLARIYIDSNGNGTYDSGEPRLGQFDGENGSGWMGTLNDFFVNSGFSDFKVGGNSPYIVEHGDEIKVVYTQNLGADVGGTWGNSNTSLSDLQFSVGTLSPTFESSVLSYDLIIPEMQANVRVTPTAVNKNFLVKTFLNTYNKDSAYYKRTESIYVKPGDVIYVGVGEQGWPTMNSQGAEAGIYTGTKYTITVYAEGAAGIVARIDAAYKDYQKITYSRYTEYAPTIAKLTEDYNALSDQSGVTNLDKLTQMQNKIAYYEQIDAVKAAIANLPKTVTATDKVQVNTAMGLYGDLEQAQKNLLTAAETNKLLKADNTVKLLAAMDKIAATKDFKSSEANTAAQVKAALEGWIGGLELGEGVTVTVAAPNPFTAAVDGTAENLSGTDGSYTAAVTVSVGSGGQMASGEKSVTGAITAKQYVKSSDAGVKSIKANGVNAQGSGTAWSAVLPYGSNVATANVVVVPADKATVSTPATSDGGATWTFTVTAEDGTTQQNYTLTLSVNDVITTAAQSVAYIVGNDATPIDVTGLVEAVSTDALDLPVGASTVSVWLEVTKTAESGGDVTVNVAPKYSVDGGAAKTVPDAAMIDDATVTLPIAGTANARVLHGDTYLAVTGSASGITFAARSGQYTLIPDALIATVTYHLNGGMSTDVTDGQQILYYTGDTAALPQAERNGYTLKGWYGSSDGSGSPVTAIAADMPGEIWAIWQSSDASATVKVSGVNATASGTIFTISLPFGSSYPAASDIMVTPADGATASTPLTEDEGASWSFKVTAEDGTEKNYTLQVEIAEQTAAEKLAAAKKTIEDADWTVSQTTANDATALKTFVEGKLATMDLNVSYEVTVTGATPAAVGTADNENGTDGSYGFTAALTLGEENATATVTGAKITAMAYVAPAPTVAYKTALNAVLPYIEGTTPNPIVGSTNGEWVVFALNRGGAGTESWNNKYLANLQTYVDNCNGKLHEKKYTEYSRVVLALTSMGVDATKFTTSTKTYDLVTPLLDKQDSDAYWAEWQGNNGTAFALLALDSHNYLDNTEGNTARAAFIASLKANQLDNGAWPISGDETSDYDVTAAAIYALAPYYLDSAKLTALGGSVSYSELKKMVDDALAFLSGAQGADGGFGSVEADIWTIIALSALKRDADTDPDFVRNGNSLLNNMLGYFIPDVGGFKHLMDGSVNQMASEQAAYGLVAYDRYKAGRNALYDMSDVEIKTNAPESADEADQAAAAAVDAKIDAIGEVTLESKAKIDAARAAYNALTDAQKALVTKLAALTAAEDSYNTLATQAEQAEIDAAAAKGADALIDAIGTVKLESESAITAARAAYDALTDAQKALVTKYETLTTAEAILAELKTAAADKAAAAAVDAQIDAIGTVTLDSETAITAARAAYDALTDAQKALVTKYATLTVAESKLTALKNKDNKPDKDKDHTITVTMRLIGAEKATKDVDLGKDSYLPNYVTWIPTTSYTLEKGSTVYDLWTTATAGYSIRSVGAENNYVETVYAPDGYALSEFTNGPRSGWMYTINGRHPGFGLCEQELYDGDVVIWHYVNDYSYEVEDWFGNDPNYPALGDGTYWNLWLKAQDTTGGSGGGVAGGDKKDEKKDGASGGEIAPAQVEVKPEVVNGEAKTELKTEDVSKALEETAGTKTLTVKVDTEGAKSIEADLPGSAVRAAADKGVGLNVETEKGTVKLSAADVKAISGKDLAVSVKENADGTTSFEVTAAGKTVETDVKIVLPAGDGQMLMIVGADGKETPVILSAGEGGKVYAEIPAGAKVKAVDAQGLSFGDVKASDWFAGAVKFVTSRGIFQGTGTGFEPNATMNRAMLVTVLQRIAGEQAKGENKFGDVKADAWYADAVIWVSENGIVNGTDAGFEPDAPVTREQIATMLYRFVQHMGVDVSARKALDGFGDGTNTSPWAKEAMEWAAGVGLFQGDDNGKLNPGGEATRAEVATLVQRLIGLMVK